MSNKKIIITLITTCLFVIGCDMQFGGGFGSTDEEFMAQLKEQLANSGIEYTEEKKGYIRYSPKHNEKVDELIEKVSRLRANRSSFKIENGEALEYVTQLMDEKAYEYRLVKKDEETWLEWYPKDEAQKQEIMFKYVEYQFSNRHDKQKHDD